MSTNCLFIPRPGRDRGDFPFDSAPWELVAPVSALVLIHDVVWSARSDSYIRHTQNACVEILADLHRNAYLME